ncbi:hypothetical protein JB92DRAFT_2827614 [Gautieria morchelliformis]|nr:hypothetical protein JB92DRAFT_2827614 [Gautieria morchelliformis]
MTHIRSAAHRFPMDLPTLFLSFSPMMMMTAVSEVSAESSPEAAKESNLWLSARIETWDILGIEQRSPLSAGERQRTEKPMYRTEHKYQARVAKLQSTNSTRFTTGDLQPYIPILANPAMMTAATGHDQSTRPAASKFLTSAVWLLICMADTSIGSVGTSYKGGLSRWRPGELEESQTRVYVRTTRDSRPVFNLALADGTTVPDMRFISPLLQELHIQDDYCHLKLPPLRARPRTATPPLSIPPTLLARSHRRRAHFAPGYTENFKAIGRHEGPRGAEDDSRGRAHSEDEELATAGQGSCDAARTIPVATRIVTVSGSRQTPFARVGWPASSPQVFSALSCGVGDDAVIGSQWKKARRDNRAGSPRSITGPGRISVKYL